MKKNELYKNKGYLLKKLQYELYDSVHAYMSTHKLNQTKLAEKLNVSKGYISQLLNANFDNKLSKIVELSIAIGKVPSLHLEDYEAVFSKQFYESFATSKFEENESFHCSDEEVPSMPSTARIIPFEFVRANGRNYISIQA